MTLSPVQSRTPFYTIDIIQNKIESIYNTTSVFLKRPIVTNAQGMELLQYRPTYDLSDHYYLLEKRIEEILHVFQENMQLDLNKSFQWCLGKIHAMESDKASSLLTIRVIRLSWHIFTHTPYEQKGIIQCANGLLSKWLSYLQSWHAIDEEERNKLVNEIVSSKIPGVLSFKSKRTLISAITATISKEELQELDFTVLILGEEHLCFCSKSHLEQSIYFKNILKNRVDFFLDLTQDPHLNQSSLYVLHECLNNLHTVHTKKWDLADLYQLYKLRYTLECPLSFFGLDNSSNQIEEFLLYLDTICLIDEPLALLLEIGYRENRPLLIQRCVDWLKTQSMTYLPEGEKIIKIKIEWEGSVSWFAPTQWLVQQSIYFMNLLDDIESQEGRIIEIDLYETNFPEPQHEMSELFLEWLQRESDFPLQKISIDNFAKALSFQQFFGLPEETIKDKVRKFLKEISMPAYLKMAKSYPIIHDYIIPNRIDFFNRTILNHPSLHDTYWQIQTRHFLMACKSQKETPISILTRGCSKFFNASNIPKLDSYFINIYLYKQKLALSTELGVELEIDYEDFDIVELECALKNFSQTYFDRLEAEIAEYKYLRRIKDPEAAAVLELIYEEMKVVYYSFYLLFQENEIGKQAEADFALLTEWMEKVEEIIKPRVNAQKARYSNLTSRVPQSRKLRNFCRSMRDTTDAYLLKFSETISKTMQTFINIIKVAAHITKVVTRKVFRNKMRVLQAAACLCGAFLLFDMFFGDKSGFTSTERGLLDNNFKHTPPKVLKDIYSSIYAISKTDQELFIASMYPMNHGKEDFFNTKPEDLFKNFTSTISTSDAPFRRLNPMLYHKDYFQAQYNTNPSPFKSSDELIDKENSYYLSTGFDSNKRNMENLEKYTPLPIVKAYMCKVNLTEIRGPVDLNTPLNCSTVHYNASKEQKKEFIQALMDKYVDAAPYVRFVTFVEKNDSAE